jgi:hypothetical protein
VVGFAEEPTFMGIYHKDLGIQFYCLLSNYFLFLSMFSFESLSFGSSNPIFGVKIKYKLNLARCLWLTPVILATQEAEIRKIEVRGKPGQIVHETLS